jgi:hypothetical protein
MKCWTTFFFNHNNLSGYDVVKICEQNSANDYYTIKYYITFYRLMILSLKRSV